MLLAKYLLFLLALTWNTHIHWVDKTKSFYILQQMVHILPLYFPRSYGKIFGYFMQVLLHLAHKEVTTYHTASFSSYDILIHTHIIFIKKALIQMSQTVRNLTLFHYTYNLPYTCLRTTRNHERQPYCLPGKNKIVVDKGYRITATNRSCTQLTAYYNMVTRFPRPSAYYKALSVNKSSIISNNSVTKLWHLHRS